MKAKRVTDELSIELSKVSTAISLIETFIGDLPDGQQKKALARLCAEANAAHDRAFDHLGKIRQAVSTI